MLPLITIRSNKRQPISPPSVSRTEIEGPYAQHGIVVRHRLRRFESCLVLMIVLASRMCRSWLSSAVRLNLAVRRHLAPRGACGDLRHPAYALAMPWAARLLVLDGAASPAPLVPVSCSRPLRVLLGSASTARRPPPCSVPPHHPSSPYPCCTFPPGGEHGAGADRVPRGGTWAIFMRCVQSSLMLPSLAAAQLRRWASINSHISRL